MLPTEYGGKNGLLQEHIGTYVIMRFSNFLKLKFFVNRLYTEDFSRQWSVVSGRVQV